MSQRNFIRCKFCSWKTVKFSRTSTPATCIHPASPAAAPPRHITEMIIRGSDMPAWRARLRLVPNSFQR